MPVSVDASVLTAVSHHTIVSFPVCECLFSECVEEGVTCIYICKAAEISARRYRDIEISPGSISLENAAASQAAIASSVAQVGVASSGAQVGIASSGAQQIASAKGSSKEADVSKTKGDVAWSPARCFWAAFLRLHLCRIFRARI